MVNLTFLVGALLVVLGGYAYTGSATRSPMALIPAVLGVLFVLLAVVGGREHLRKHAMHGAAALALLGVLGGVGPLAMGGSNRFPPLMMRATTGMMVLCAVFLFFAVRSFVSARRARTAA